MSRRRPFQQVDVFTTVPYRGNPVAVVLDGEGLTTEEMQQAANWTNLSETTFVLPPTDPLADYRVRIFTPVAELPFAGHPTLGTCHAWLRSGGEPNGPELVQECRAGLIRIKRGRDRLAFEAPPLIRSGPVDEALVMRMASLLGIDRGDIVDAQWVDNGPGFVAALLHSAAAVLALRPGAIDIDLGVVGPYPPGSETAFEVRAWFPAGDATVEDPVTGSFNAGLAGWLLGSGRATAPYVASQGTVLGRAGRVHVDREGDTIWVGGGTITLVEGEIEI